MKDSDIYLPGTHWTKISRRDLLRSGAAAGALWAVRSPATGFRSAMPRSQLSAGSGFVTPFCEWLADPLGIHQQNPRLSWRFPEMKAGLDQAAYQIIVSSTPEGSPDLWDSGEIESAEVAVIY